MKPNNSKNAIVMLAVLICLSALNPQLSAAPLGTAFTYQGRLNDGANPASGNYDLRFALYDGVTNGSAMAGPLTNAATAVSNGLFAVMLDAGPVFDGTALWLEIAVRTNGSSGDFTTLSPRQPLTLSPYAFYASKAGMAASAISATAVAANGVATASLQANAVTADKIADGTLTAADLSAVLASNTFWRQDGNGGTVAGTNFLGTTDNQPLEFKVNGVRAFRLEPSGSNPPNVIGGYSENYVAPGLSGVTISGGGSIGFPNSAGGDKATIGGGYKNTNNSFGGTLSGGIFSIIHSGATAATIGGGQGHTIQSNASSSTIAGGYGNQIQTGSQGATISGGAGNAIQSNSLYTAIGGGSGNTILSNVAWATIPGGRLITAGSSLTFAAGYRAKAMHPGAFVWADSTDADFASAGTNQFLIRASGGVGIGTNAPVSALHVNGTITAAAFAGDGAGLINLNASQLTAGTLPSAQLAGSYSEALTFSSAANSYTGSGAGLTDLNAAELTSGTVPDARLAASIARTNEVWLLEGNAGTKPGSQFLGTTDSQPLELKVNNVRALRIVPTVNDATHSNMVNVVGGSPANTIASGVYGSVIAGGGAGNYLGSSHSNTISADMSFLGGGIGNSIQIKATNAVLGGGCANVIQTNAFGAFLGAGYTNSIQTNSYCAFLGGGQNNSIQVNAKHSFLGSGYHNTVQQGAYQSFLGSGNYNTNGGACCMLPGGYMNLAGGDFSFAAGCFAKATNNGSFVWGDTYVGDVNSTNDNSVTMRASGGYRLFSNSGMTAGVYLAPGGSSWASISDRNAKKNFAAVDPVEVLDKLAAISIQRWNYKWEADDATPNLGPMAQDFKTAFYPGRDDKSITTLEYDGVALAAIQGLNRKLEEQRADNAALKRELAELKAMVQTLGRSFTSPSTSPN
jgi:hypothetical protein